MTDPVKAKIQSLCPDVMEDLECNCGHIFHDELGNKLHSITLAVVLRAIEKATKMLEPYGISILPDGAFYDQKNGKVFTDGRVAKDLHEASKMRIRWNLSKDNYDDQDEATKAFIGSLILN
jgi:hypothetical protein